MRKRTLFYTLAITSAFLNVFIVTIDSYTTTFYVRDALVYGLLNFYIGSLTGLGIVLFFSIKIRDRALGSVLDPNFIGFRLLRRDELKIHAVAALGNALSSIGYFLIVVSAKDPSVVLPFTQVSILYLMIGEVFVEKDTPSVLEVQSLLMVTFGALLASISPVGELRLKEFLIVLTFINTGRMLLVLSQRKLRLMKVNGRRVDSITIRIWNLLLTTIVFSAIVFLIYPKSIKKSFEYVGDYDVFTLVFSTMTLTFISQVLYIRALGIGKSSITQGVNSISTVFSFVSAIILSNLYPQSFQLIPINTQFLLIKLIGLTLLTFGIIALATGEVKAYVFIKTKPGPQREIIEKIWRIKGVKVLSAVAGGYDLILKIKIRALGKAYSRIVRKLEEIPNIEDFRWITILKEYEEI